MRKWLLVPAILIVVLLIGLLVARATLTPERIRGLVQPRLEAALQRPVELGAIHVRTFPLAIQVDSISIAAPAGFPSAHLLHIGRLQLEPRLAPLLRRRIVIRTARIESPQVWVEQRADSLSNWALPQTPGRATPPRAAKPGGADLTIETLVLQDGRIHLNVEPAAIALEVPLAAEVSLRADRALRDVRLGGWLAADSIRGRAGIVRDLRLPALRIEPDVRVNVPDSSATLERIRVFVNRAAIDVRGTARQRGGKPEVHLETHAEGLDLAELLAAVPVDAPATRGLKAAGTVQFDLRADVVPGTPPVAHGRLRLRDGSVQAATLPERISALNIDVELAGDSLRIEEIAARLGDAPVRLRGLVTDALNRARTQYDLQVEAALDLSRLARVAPLPPGVSLAGTADVDVRARGRIARPDSVALDGPIVLRGVVVKTPQLAQPLHIDARLEGAATALRVVSARLVAGQSAIDVTGTVWPALPPKRPRAELQARAPRLDLVELLPKAAPAPDSAPAGSTPRPGSAPGVIPPLPPLDLRLRLEAGEVVLQGSSMRDVTMDVRSDGRVAHADLRAATLRAGETTLYGATAGLQATDGTARGTVRATRATLHKLEATNLESDVEITGHTIRLPTMRARAYAGTLRGTTLLDLAVPSRPRYEIDATADDLQFGAFLATFAPIGGAVTGSLDLKSNWKFAGPGPEIIRSTLDGSGHAASLNGRIAAMPLLSELAKLLQLPNLNSIPYRDLGLDFSVQQGRLAMRDAVLRSPDADFGIGGSIGLDGALDLALQMTLSQELSKRALATRGTNLASSLFTDANGRLVFDVGVGGTYRAPRLSLDLRKTAARAGVAALSESVLRRILGGQLPNLPFPGGSSPGSVPGGPVAGSDSSADTTRAVDPATALQQRALEEARKRLGGNLGGLLGTPADTTRRPF